MHGSIRLRIAKDSVPRYNYLVISGERVKKVKGKPRWLVTDFHWRYPDLNLPSCMTFKQAIFSGSSHFFYD